MRSHRLQSDRTRSSQAVRNQSLTVTGQFSSRRADDVREPRSAGVDQATSELLLRSGRVAHELDTPVNGADDNVAGLPRHRYLMRQVAVGAERGPHRSAKKLVILEGKREYANTHSLHGEYLRDAFTMGRTCEPNDVNTPTSQRLDGVGKRSSAMLHHVIVRNIQHVEARLNEAIPHVGMPAHLHGQRARTDQALV